MKAVVMKIRAETFEKAKAVDDLLKEGYSLTKAVKQAGTCRETYLKTKRKRQPAPVTLEHIPVPIQRVCAFYGTPEEIAAIVRSLS